MEKEFVPYEQALALKELGFDEPCFATIDQIEYVHIKGTKSAPRGSMMYDTINCPIFSQAFRWFREKYGYYIVPQAEIEINRIEVHFLIIKFGEKKVKTKKFNTNEQAELECLKKLIEIVKKNG